MTDIKNYKAPRMTSTDWMVALQRGQTELQKWLSKAGKQPLARYPSSDDGKAAELLKFRMTTSMLHEKCCKMQESNRKKRNAQREMIHNHRLEAKEVKRWKWKNTGKKPQKERTQQTKGRFVSRESVEESIKKRTRRKASSKMPWAAYRATTETKPCMSDLVRAIIDVTWATCKVDTGSTTVELAHLHKGKFGPTDAPPNPTDPLASLTRCSASAATSPPYGPGHAS